MLSYSVISGFYFDLQHMHFLLHEHHLLTGMNFAWLEHAVLTATTVRSYFGILYNSLGPNMTSTKTAIVNNFGNLLLKVSNKSLSLAIVLSS